MFSLKVLLLLVNTLGAYRVYSRKTNRYLNKFDGKLYVGFNNFMVTGLYSRHSNSREDRIWKVYFGKASSPSGRVTCSDHIWTDYLNKFYSDLKYSCPADHAISGFISIHDNYYEDRRWKVRCCKVYRARLAVKEFTDRLNLGDDVLDFTCEDDEVLVGVRAVRDYSKRDRQWYAQCGRLLPADDIVFNARLTPFQNDWGGSLRFGGEKNLVINGIYSVHKNGAEDRRWKFRYGSTKGWDLRKKGQSSNKRIFCHDKGWPRKYSTRYWKDFTFNCPQNRFLNGVASKHNNKAEDRIWVFKCCEMSSGVSVQKQAWTGYLNKLDGVLTYTCPRTNQAIVGLSSVWGKRREDRRWKVRCGMLVIHDREL